MKTLVIKAQAIDPLGSGVSDKKEITLESDRPVEYPFRALLTIGQYQWLCTGDGKKMILI